MILLIIIVIILFIALRLIYIEIDYFEGGFKPKHFIISLLIAGVMVGLFTYLYKISPPSTCQCQYTITYSVYYPTETKKVTKTGVMEIYKDEKPQPRKITRRNKVKIKVGFDVIYEGRSDVEINSFTYRKM